MLVKRSSCMLVTGAMYCAPLGSTPAKLMSPASARTLQHAMASPSAPTVGKPASRTSLSPRPCEGKTPCPQGTGRGLPHGARRHVAGLPPSLPSCDGEFLHSPPDYGPATAIDRLLLCALPVPAAWLMPRLPLKFAATLPLRLLVLVVACGLLHQPSVPGSLLTLLPVIS